MMDKLIVLSFVVGFIPALTLFIAYGGWTEWKSNPAGRIVLTLIGMFIASYLISMGTLIFPGFFHGDIGEIVRIISRFIIAFGMWRLLGLFLKVQSLPRLGKKQDQ